MRKLEERILVAIQHVGQEHHIPMRQMRIRVHTVARYASGGEGMTSGTVRTYSLCLKLNDKELEMLNIISLSQGMTRMEMLRHLIRKEYQMMD